MRPRLPEDPNQGYEDALSYPRLDRVTDAFLLAHGAFAVSLAALAFVDGANALFVGGATLIAATAVAVPLLYRPRASSHGAWRFSATAGIATLSFVLVALGSPFGPRAHFLLGVVYLAAYADWRLPASFALGVLPVHAALAALEPGWVGGPSELSFATPLLVAAVPASWIARAYGRAVVDRERALRDLAEDALRRRRLEEALRTEEERLLAVLDAFPEGTLILDTSGRVLQANHAATELLAARRHELVRRATTDPSWGIVAESTAGLPAAEVLRTGQAVHGIPCEVRRPDGVRRVSASLVPIAGAQGRPVGVVVSIRDETERHREREELEAARRQLAHSEKLSALGTLVSGVAHEIRTPLTYIQNNLFIAETRLHRATKEGLSAAEAEAEIDGPLATALEGVARINHLVNELRRLTRGKPGERHALPLHEVVGQAVELFRATHRGRTEVTTSLNATLPCDIDPVQIQEVVLNLLENAADAMKGRGTVHVSTVPSLGGADLVVEDDGPGIPEDIRPRIFDEFFTTKPDGTGLGLSIIRRIVESHEGTITLENGTDGGARFRIHLPHRPAPQATVATR